MLENPKPNLNSWVLGSGVQKVVEKEYQIPDDWTASERARQAAADKLPLSMCLDLKSFSNMGQKTVSRARIGSSEADPAGELVARWLKTVPILKSKQWNLKREKE